MAKDERVLDNVGIEITCEVGRKEMSFDAVRRLQLQDVIELGKLAGEAFDLRMNGRLFGLGEVVVVTDLMAVRVTNLVAPPEEGRS